MGCDGVSIALYLALALILARCTYTIYQGNSEIHRRMAMGIQSTLHKHRKGGDLFLFTHLASHSRGVRFIYLFSRVSASSSSLRRLTHTGRE